MMNKLSVSTLLRKGPGVYNLEGCPPVRGRAPPLFGAVRACPCWFRVPVLASPPPRPMAAGVGADALAVVAVRGDEGFTAAATSEELLGRLTRGLRKCQEGRENAGGALAEGQPGFDVRRFMSVLTTKVLGRTMLAAARMPSTQTFVQDCGHHLPDGSIVLADQQVAGKGRGGNSWVSPEGCLMFSLCKRVSLPGQQLPFVQYVVALSVVQAAQDVASGLAEGCTLKVDIKWPNDLYMKGLKVYAAYPHLHRDGAFLLAVGVGLNLSNREPTTCLNGELVGDPGGDKNPIDPASMLAAVMNRLESNLEVMEGSGFALLQGPYIQHWMHSQQEVTLEEEVPGVGPKLVRLTIQGLTQTGFLLATDGFGGKYELHPDGNSLDFFKGLMRKKIY